MFRIFSPVWLLTAMLLTADIFLATAATEPPAWRQDSANKVFYLPQFSEFKAISEGEMRFFRKAVERAEKARAKALILELDTPGGSVETAFKYLSAMEKSSLPVIVYLNPNGISAGMLIAMGADRVAISPNGIIGDAMPVTMGLNGVKPVTEKPDTPNKTTPEENNKKAPAKSVEPAGTAADELKLPEIIKEILREKNISKNSSDIEEKALADQKFLTVFFKMLQVVAEKNDRPVKVIRAMADPYTELDKASDGIEHKKRSPLTLSAREAKQLKVVDYIASDRADLLAQLGLADAQIVEVKRSTVEEIGAFLATPALAGLLLVIGLIGIFVEIKTPGFGVPGVLGLGALTLFFLGHIASGASDWGPMVVFFVGMLLIALEIFVIPGFGLIGALGLLCVLVSFFWAFGFENISTALRVITLSLLTAITAMIMLAIYVLPKTTLFRKVSLDTELSSKNGCKAQAADDTLVGSNGVTVTPLRPAGIVRIGDRRYDAASEGDFLEAGVEVIVSKRNGFQLVVRSKDA